MTLYRYMEDSDVHVIDCAGGVDLEIGLAHWKTVQLELEARPIQGPWRKLLIDFRGTIWASEEVHMQLSAITRRDFGLNASNTAIRVAVVNHRWSGLISENERWFASESDALDWLCGH